jgi:hypothetical protein
LPPGAKGLPNVHRPRSHGPGLGYLRTACSITTIKPSLLPKGSSLSPKVRQGPSKVNQTKPPIVVELLVSVQEDTPAIVRPYLATEDKKSRLAQLQPASKQEAKQLALRGHFLSIDCNAWYSFGLVTTHNQEGERQPAFFVKPRHLPPYSASLFKPSKQTLFDSPCQRVCSLPPTLSAPRKLPEDLQGEALHRIAADTLRAHGSTSGSKARLWLPILSSKPSRNRLAHHLGW